MEKSKIINEASDFAKKLCELSKDERDVVKGIIIGMKLKSEIKTDKNQKGA